MRNKWVTAFGFVVRDANKEEHFGHVLVKKKLDMNPESGEVWALIRKAIRWSKPVEPLEMLDFGGTSVKVRD